MNCIFIYISEFEEKIIVSFSGSLEKYNYTYFLNNCPSSFYSSVYKALDMWNGNFKLTLGLNGSVRFTQEVYYFLNKKQVSKEEFENYEILS